MEYDVGNPVDAVDRALVQGNRDGASTRIVRAERRYATDVEDLWDALTRADRLARWFTPVSGDLQLGGRYRLEGNASGEILRCDRPHRLEVTWEYAEEVSWVTVTLAPDGDGARLTLEHAASDVADDRWTQFGPGAVGVGWDLALLGLGMHVSTGTAMDPAAAETWSVSPEGRGFIRRASDEWGRASTAAGTPEAEATAAADRTTAFYTGEPVPDDPADKRRSGDETVTTGDEDGADGQAAGS